jgi:two-component sensor histidine kinase
MRGCAVDDSAAQEIFEQAEVSAMKIKQQAERIRALESALLDTDAYASDAEATLLALVNAGRKVDFRLVNNLSIILKTIRQQARAAARPLKTLDTKHPSR